MEYWAETHDNGVIGNLHKLNVWQLLAASIFVYTQNSENRHPENFRIKHMCTSVHTDKNQERSCYRDFILTSVAEQKVLIRIR